MWVWFPLFLSVPLYAKKKKKKKNRNTEKKKKLGNYNLNLFGTIFGFSTAVLPALTWSEEATSCQILNGKQNFTNISISFLRPLSHVPWSATIISVKKS